MRSGLSTSFSARLPHRVVSAGVAVLVSLLYFPSTSLAGGIFVGSGNIMRLDTSVWNLGCNDVEIAADATLEGEQATVVLAGNWTNNGVFNPGMSTVNFIDGCDPNMSTVAGDTTFYDFVAETSLGKQMKFEAGSTQTILGLYKVQGAPGNLLEIVSTVPGQPAFTEVMGGQMIDGVDVSDNHATGIHIAPGPPGNYNSIDSPGNSRWFLNDFAVPAPALSAWGSAIAVLVLLLLARFAMRTSQRKRFAEVSK